MQILEIDTDVTELRQAAKVREEGLGLLPLSAASLALLKDWGSAAEEL